MTGDEFKAARMALGLTQLELAEAMGVSRGLVIDWERGRDGHHRPVAVPRLAELALATLTRSPAAL